MADFREVTDCFYVAPQISVSDVKLAATSGFKALIMNRPENETGDQPDTSAIISAAESEGMKFFFIPITAPPHAGDIAATLAALSETGEDKVLAFCRSGTRSVTLWAYAMAENGAMSVDEILKHAKSAGYDLGGHRRILETLG